MVFLIFVGKSLMEQLSYKDRDQDLVMDVGADF